MNNIEFLRNLENREITLNDWCEASLHNAKIIPYFKKNLKNIPKKVAEKQ